MIACGSLGEAHLAGDLLSLWMTLMMSIIMVVYRRCPQTPAGRATRHVFVVLLPFGLYFSDPFAAPINEIVIVATFVLIFAVASVMLHEGARRLLPAEATLISAAKKPLAPSGHGCCFLNYHRSIPLRAAR